MTEAVNEALRLIASRFGLDAHTLSAVGDSPPMPTFAEYIQRLRNALSATTTHSYDPYWRVVENAWGQRTLDAPTVTEINELVTWHRGRARVRADSRGGRGAATHMVSAIRCIYRHAEFDGLISLSTNPARLVKELKRLASSRFVLTRERVIAIGEVCLYNRKRHRTRRAHNPASHRGSLPSRWCAESRTGRVGSGRLLDSVA